MKKMQELKEEFRKIYETSENPTEGMLSISEWLAKSSSVFTKSCQTIRNWFGEIISYFERRTTRLFVTWYGLIGGHKSTKSLSGKRLN
ncbi:transposase [Microcystis aeruginosa TAIHU98]|uniref:Transposase n=1 Tax=Microcystis aeruginosa TAIHU98 TaxID=1134457 RepID=L7E6Y5_MICAE|nr:transposase [Microcystis aeruginosa TAIHU98]